MSAENFNEFMLEAACELAWRSMQDYLKEKGLTLKEAMKDDHFAEHVFQWSREKAKESRNEDDEIQHVGYTPEQMGYDK